MLIVIPLTAIFQRLKPKDKGLLPDGEDSWPAKGNGQGKEHLIQNALVVDEAWLQRIGLWEEQ